MQSCKKHEVTFEIAYCPACSRELENNMLKTKIEELNKEIIELWGKLSTP